MEQKGFTDKIKWLAKPLNGYCVECLYLICAMLIVRIAETIALFATNYNAELIGNNLIGFAVDIANIGWIVAALYVVYSLISLLSQKAANITIRFIFGFYLCLSMLLVGYFATTHIPLDGIISAYSPKELLVTVKANSPYNVPIIIGIIIISVVFAAIPRKKFNLPSWLQIVIIALLAGCAFFPGLEKEKFRYDKEYYIIESKTAYLFNSLSKNESIIQFTDKELKEKAEEFASYFPEYEFVDYHYPFLHSDKTPDILSGYLEKSDNKPNIVILIVEGLCNYISGQNSTATSATPFLDSLSEHALVWENCLSTSERTFGVLPSLLGALPFGENGFLSYRRDVPDHNTLASILHSNGYKNTFFYGGWYGFDGMDIFSENNFMEMYYRGPDYEQIAERSQWGLRDEYLLSHSLNDVKESGNTPRLDIYLTLSTHDPFDYPDKEKYTSQYNEMQAAHPEKTQIKKLIGDYASFVYVDNCLRKFIDQYKECETFDNTIFVITGDHRFVSTKSNPMENFRVPLIIWSPMLRESCRFKALVSHRNITPSLLSYMSHTYNIEVPQNAVWINSGLDTSSNFSTKTFAPHFGADRKLKAITYGENFITRDKTYRFDYTNDKLSIIPTNNKHTGLTDLYQALEQYIMNNNALVPNE